MSGPTVWRGSVLSLALCLALAACASGGGARGADPAAAPTAAEVDAASPRAPAVDSAQVAPAGGMPSAGDPAGQVPPGQTQAEQDYTAIYGTPGQTPYDPVADPTLPAPAQLPASYDPWERWNRGVHRFNNTVDRTIARPLAKVYVKVVPRPVRTGVHNFFNNLRQPVSMVNALLQGRPSQAGQSLMRFAVNTTVGVAGLFDPATRFEIPNRSEDFGQTLGVWGWKRSRYFELPLFGPRTVRDTFGLLGDAPLAPLHYVEEDKIRVPLQGLQLVDVRTQLLAVDSMREGMSDDYTLIRDAWLQRRSYQIDENTRRSREENQALPEYLREDDENPTVPVDVMPIVPYSPNSGG